MRETKIHIGDGLCINDEYVDCGPEITVYKMGTLYKVNIDVLVDEQNFTFDYPSLPLHARVNFDGDCEDDTPTHNDTPTESEGPAEEVPPME